MVFDDKERNTGSRLRALYDLGMGILWIAVGVFFLFHEKFNFELGLDKVLTSIFGFSSLLYGGFRIYRGIKKK